MRIDGLQYGHAGAPEIFQLTMAEGRVDSVRGLTSAYHETFRKKWLAVVQVVESIFRALTRPPLVQAFTAADVRQAKAEGRTAIIFGFQTPSPREDDIGQ